MLRRADQDGAQKRKKWSRGAGRRVQGMARRRKMEGLQAVTDQARRKDADATDRRRMFILLRSTVN